MPEELNGWKERVKAYCEARVGPLGIFTPWPEEWKPLKCARCGASVEPQGFDAYVPSCAECRRDVDIAEYASSPKNFDGVGKPPSFSVPRATHLLAGAVMAAVGTALTVFSLRKRKPPRKRRRPSKRARR